MNLALMGPEVLLVALGLALLLMDLVVPMARRQLLGCAGALFVFALFLYMALSTGRGGSVMYAFDGMFVVDGLAAFFKAIFLLAGTIVLLLAADWLQGAETGVTEYYVLILFALVGMMSAASANDFAVMYVALELVTVTFYVLTSYERSRRASLEAGVKYLILGALSSAFLVYGIALCFGASGTTNFNELAARSAALADDRLFRLGMLLILGGLCFKVALFPFQIWAPDVYEGSPVPTTAFLAIGSKGAGVVLLVRLFGAVVPDLARRWETLLMVMAAVSIIYGSLCALPQRSLRRLLGYSSIANGGFVVIGLAAVSKVGSAAVLFYLAGYLFTILAAFLVTSVVVQRLGNDDIASLAGLHQSSPLLAAALTLAMVSLAGVPPLAGFFGKFLVLRALIEQPTAASAYYWPAAVVVAGVAISFWYYFGVVRSVYWPRGTPGSSTLPVPPLTQIAVIISVAGMIYLGIFPQTIWDAAVAAVAGLRL